METSSPSRGSILVVDDEPTIAEVVARYLERAGYETRVAADGPSAVAAAQGGRPDLVVLDIMLPGFDGLEAMRRIHEDLEGRTPTDGSVTVRAASAGEWVEIEVADTGTGIGSAERELFVRGDTARPGGGAGLGLAISRAIVEAHGGRIWLADSDVGTRVRFVIPT